MLAVFPSFCSLQMSNLLPEKQAGLQLALRNMLLCLLLFHLHQ
jgi:hypothetical protein